MAQYDLILVQNTAGTGTDFTETAIADGTAGQVFTTDGSGTMSFASVTIPVNHAYAIDGDVTDKTYVGFNVYVPSGFTCTLKKIIYGLASGTCNLTVVKEGTDVTSPDYDELSVSSTETSTSGDVSLSDADYLQVKIDSGSSPVDLHCTFCLLYTKTA